MSKKANPAVIGSFVLGAIALLVLALVVLGGQELFRERLVYVSIFDGSAQGLRVGANVNFVGVRVGEVTDIHLRYDPDTSKTDIAVVMDLGRGSMRTVSGERYVVSDPNQMIQDLIDAGVRAELSMESFVTGQLVVELDFHPDTEPVFRAYDLPLPEMPTVPSGIERVIESAKSFAQRVLSLPIEKIVNDLGRVTGTLAELAETNSLENILKGLDTFVNDAEFQALAGSLHETLADLRTSLSSFRELADSVDAKVDPIADNVVSALTEAEVALSEVERLAAQVRRDFAGDSEARYELFRTVREVERAARALRLFVEMLEERPESLLKGKTHTE